MYQSVSWGAFDSNRLVVWESPGLPVQKECSYICAVIGEARSLCSELVTESYRVMPAVRVELVLRELRRLLELLLWTDFSCSRIFPYTVVEVHHVIRDGPTCHGAGC